MLDHRSLPLGEAPNTAEYACFSKQEAGTWDDASVTDRSPNPGRLVAELLAAWLPNAARSEADPKLLQPVLTCLG
jgi:hypothetical protein